MFKRFRSFLSDLVSVVVEEDESNALPLNITEDEMRMLGISGEYYHHLNNGTVDEFIWRFGPRIYKDLPRERERLAALSEN